MIIKGSDEGWITSFLLGVSASAFPAICSSRYSAVILSNVLEATFALVMPNSLALARTSLLGIPTFFAISYMRTGIRLVLVRIVQTEFFYEYNEIYFLISLLSFVGGFFHSFLFNLVI